MLNHSREINIVPLKKYLIFCFTLSFFTITKSNDHDTLNLIESEQSWFISVNYGYQMSGLKSEDFVSSNYTPLFYVTVGKWLSPYFALQAGYKGFYFNYIKDDINHHYNFFYGEAVLNLSKAVFAERINKRWNLLLHTGVGHFYYNKPNICANVGLQNIFQITNQIQATFDITSIIGWDIYQGDTDILPGITLGVVYLFCCN
jgi:hypothetical protein